MERLDSPDQHKKQTKRYKLPILDNSQLQKDRSNTIITNK